MNKLILFIVVVGAIGWVNHRETAKAKALADSLLQKEEQTKAVVPPKKEAPKLARKAQDGTVYLKRRIAVTHDAGSRGIEAGTSLSILEKRQGLLRVQSDGLPFEIELADVTDDLDEAFNIQRIVALQKVSADRLAQQKADEAFKLERERQQTGEKQKPSSAVASFESQQQEPLFGERGENPLNRGAYDQHRAFFPRTPSNDSANEAKAKDLQNRIAAESHREKQLAAAEQARENEKLQKRIDTANRATTTALKAQVAEINRDARNLPLNKRLSGEQESEKHRLQSEIRKLERDRSPLGR